ncbi:BQ2448_1130 [Microbotryum intermedium]|uniref:BQ2448_1130 protein n=1 Tax=Microbotryum intermedium TaxID=269621 RepID=A0A238FF75_9BASI|nr:BQ2448_1130 [Microbotryum intermedium]
MARSPQSYDRSEPRDPKRALPHTYPYSDNTVAVELGGRTPTEGESEKER